MTFYDHLIKNTELIKFFKCKNLNDSNIIAILLVETYYRPLYFRLFEYLYWVITGNKNITVGLAQIKISYIKQLQNLCWLERLKFITSLESYIQNYILIKQYIDTNPNLKNDLDICKYYNGKNVNKSYILNFKHAKLYINSLS